MLKTPFFEGNLSHYVVVENPSLIIRQHFAHVLCKVWVGKSWGAVSVYAIYRNPVRDEPCSRYRSKAAAKTVPGELQRLRFAESERVAFNVLFYKGFKLVVNYINAVVKTGVNPGFFAEHLEGAMKEV